jgi:hypothetical protein
MTEDYLPEFGLPDSEGFRTFALYTPERCEAIRVCVQIENARQFFINTSGDLTRRYTEAEVMSLRDAAAFGAARNDAREKAGPIDQDSALKSILTVIPEVMIEDIERYFPPIAKIALQVAADACAKRTLNNIMRSMGAAAIYNEAFVDLLLADLKKAIMDGLDIDRGRPSEVSLHLAKTREAVIRLRDDQAAMKRLAGAKPTSEDIASRVDGETDERTVRRWAQKAGLNWHEWLRASGWPE